jgi:hypothetical protein
VSAEAHGLREGTDPRYRVDLGKLLSLTERLCDGEIWKPILFGSRPPPNDTVWKAARQRNFELHIKDRDSRGREKEVDPAIIAEFLNEVWQVPADMIDETVFVMVTGDRDMRPAIKTALDRNMPVYLMAFRRSVASVYGTLHGGLFRVIPLDDHIDSFSYTSCRSTRPKNIDAAQALVINLRRAYPELWQDAEKEELTEAEKKSVTQSLCSTLLRTREVFYHGNIFQHHLIVVEFSRLDTHASLPKVQRHLPRDAVEPYTNWRARSAAEAAAAEAAASSTRLTNYYKPFERKASTASAAAAAVASAAGAAGVAAAAVEGEGSDDYSSENMSSEDDKVHQPAAAAAAANDEEAAPGAAAVAAAGDPAADPGEGYTLVKARHSAASREARLRRKCVPCVFGIHCVKAGDCGFQHTDDEKAIFAHFLALKPKVMCDFRQWKSVACTNSRPHDARRCMFSHGEQDMRWCTFCRKDEHLRSNCPIQGPTPPRAVRPPAAPRGGYSSRR